MEGSTRLKTREDASRSQRLPLLYLVELPAGKPSGRDSNPQHLAPGYLSGKLRHRIATASIAAHMAWKASRASCSMNPTAVTVQLVTPRVPPVSGHT